MREYVNKSLILLLIVFSLIMAWPTAICSEEEEPEHIVYTVKVENTVTAATAQHIKRGIKLAEDHGASALVLLINTPGGLVTPTLEIIQDISAARVPVISYVSPRGAIAASAGTFILLGGHLAAMSPGTTCGAAMPVNISNPLDNPQAADQKTINFLAGHMKSIAVERGRSGELAENFVKENLTLNYHEAFDNGMVDIVAADLKELLIKIHGRELIVNQETKNILTDEARVIELEMSRDEKFINILGNPMLAMILLMLGIYGLIIGFSSPGFFFPEVLGSLSLILGLYGLGLFETNLTAALLLVLGIGLLLAEVFTPTYGILGVGGVIAIISGIMFFPVEPIMPLSWFNDLKIMALGLGLISALFLSIVLMGILRLRKLRIAHDDREFIRQAGTVVGALKPYGQIKVQGEIWQALSKNGTSIAIGEKVKIIERQGILLIVELSSAEEKDD
jgi:membrane-bound serine protease (ClpP class)